ncbi:MAG: hypothetical protein NC925_01565 [Candidatus Omnitrophica bacterium]|nr:hypothetical protein [Candidatus Omnitrophota bacterium]MCM8832057.1 hypothetical protein [Candidatus Omnitrophota bacterium]
MDKKLKILILIVVIFIIVIFIINILLKKYEEEFTPLSEEKGLMLKEEKDEAIQLEDTTPQESEEEFLTGNEPLLN